jgi:hypothetical protein
VVDLEQLFGVSLLLVGADSSNMNVVRLLWGRSIMRKTDDKVGEPVKYRGRCNAIKAAHLLNSP